MIGPRSDIPSMQSDFYREQYHRVLNWLLVSVATMIILIAALIYVILHQSPQKYYANTTEGKIFPMPKPIVQVGKP